MSKSVTKGQIIDSRCTVNGSLVEYKGKVYSCTLNQTDIDANKNKFYIMQLIKNGSSYTHLIIYGRTGEVGRISHTPYTSEDTARSVFEKQFKAKTGNSWWTDSFTKKDGKYFMSEVSYEDELKDIKDDPVTIPDSKLPERTQNLIKMLSDINMMQNALVSLDIDTKKMPLGKIKQSQLDKAGEVLDKIQEVIKELSNKGAKVEELKSTMVKLSSDYYTYVPYACGRKKPPVINTEEMVGKYRDILTELGNIIVTVQITNNVKSGENPIDGIYNDINTKIIPVEKTDKIWTEIEKYIKNTHGSTHGAKLELIDIFAVEQNGKQKLFDDYCKNINNRNLLFHGTPQSCVLSIFKRDFYLDPSKLKDVNVQIAGKMFGYGVYFADCCTKSFNYTRAKDTKDIGCFVMAEVALGEQLKKLDADYYLNQNTMIKEKCHSTKGVGKWEPSSSTIIDNVKIPNGPLHVANNTTSLRYNEHIVYDINQILIKYLVIVKNNGGYGGY